MKYWVLTIIFSLAASVAIADDKVRVLEEDIKFLDFHDMGYMQLKTKSGTVYEPLFYYHFISMDKILEWKKGELVNIIYKPSFGFGIFRKSDGKTSKVVFFPDESHPYHEVYEQCQDSAVTTIDIVECYIDFEKKLESEYRFLYENLKLNSSSELEYELVKLDGLYRDLRESYLKTYSLNANEGSIHQVIMSRLSLRLVKNKLNLLLHLFEYRK